MIKRLLAVLLLVGYLPMGFAHDPGLSSADLVLTATGINAKITFSLQDIEAFVPMDSDQDAEVAAAEQEAAKARIVQWVLAGVQLSVDGVVIAPNALGKVSFDDKNNAFIAFQFDQAASKNIGFNALFLSKLPTTHRQYATLKDEAGHSLGEKMLSQTDNRLSVAVSAERAAAPEAHTFSDFLLLGIEHILTGYDHLLFLFSLLVVTRSFWPALKIITFFTLAHSITLGLAGFNIIDIPSAIVEPLIAATIVYVGLENIVRGDQVKGRQWLTFFFGLIHGFGFASVLREMGISSYETGIMLPLFSFNLGVELGQVTVAAMVLPIIWWLHKKPLIEPKLTPVCSILVCVAGGYWLVERTLLS